MPEGKRWTKTGGHFFHAGGAEKPIRSNAVGRLRSISQFGIPVLSLSKRQESGQPDENHLGSLGLAAGRRLRVHILNHASVSAGIQRKGAIKNTVTQVIALQKAFGVIVANGVGRISMELAVFTIVLLVAASQIPGDFHVVFFR